MLTYFGERISPHMTDTPEGYLICHDVPIGRIGRMSYLARELGLEGDPERRVAVCREADEVFDPAALASFEGKPVTDGHPPEHVSPENFALYCKGHVQNVRRRGEWVVADLHLMDPTLAGDVRARLKREISCGYTCLYESCGGEYRQRQIRGNHVAVVPRGRAGRTVAIQDEERRNTVKQETKEAVLRFFGLAARDAEPEELEQMSRDAAALMEESAQAAPQTAEGLEAKVERLIALMEGEAEKCPEKALDRAIAARGGEAGVVSESGQEDTATRMLRGVRPAIAALRDPAEKRAVTDALLESLRGNEAPGARLLEHAAAAARLCAQDCDPQGQAKAQQAAYNARNPHRNQKEGN